MELVRLLRLRPALVLATILLLPGAAVAASFTVDTTADDATRTACQDAVPNDCSLRGAILAANSSPGADTINVPAGTYALTIFGFDDSGAAGDLDITDSVTLVGAGAAVTVIRGFSGPPGPVEQPVFQVHGPIAVLLSGVTIEGGTSSGISFSGSALTIANSTIRSNLTRGLGGAIAGDGTLTILDSTLHSNGSRAPAGAMLVSGTLVMRNTTISGNHGLFTAISFAGHAELNNVTMTQNAGGGIETSTADTVVVIRNSIMADSGFPACAGPGTLVSEGYNLIGTPGSCIFVATTGDLIGVDPQVAPLGDYGGPTPTHALCTAPGVPDASCAGVSPALDAGNPAPPGGGGTACEATDQRGVPRPEGSTCDIGAYERVVAQPPSPAPPAPPGGPSPAPPTPPTNPVTTFTAALNAPGFSTGQTMVLTVTLTPGTSSIPVDVYLVVQLPDGTLVSLRADRSAVPGLAPLVTNVSLRPFTGEFLRFTFTGTEPAGLYRWYAAVTEAGTLRVIGNVSQTLVTFSP